MVNPTFYVYILYSPSRDRFYVGSTNDLRGRIERHNSSKYGYTRSGRPWALVYHESFHSRSEAVLRESQIKRWKSAKKIRELISG